MERLFSGGGSDLYLLLPAVTFSGLCRGVYVHVCPQLWAYQEVLLKAPLPEPSSDGTQSMYWALSRRRALKCAQLPL